MRFFRFVIALLCCLSSASGVLAQDFLDPTVAFKADASMRDAATLEIRFNIADGYYLYRERFKFEAVGASLGTPVIPLGKIKYDENFEKNVETYHHGLVVTIPVQASADFQLKLTQQGCADAGLCYPPMELMLPVSVAGLQGLAGGVSSSGVGVTSTEMSDDGFSISSALKGGKLFVIIPLFLLLGLGLSLTPCVLPMVPILSYIIVGEGAAIARHRGLLLSFIYVMGMALVYTMLGVAAGLLGEGLSAALQNPWVLSAFAGLMVILALAMFGVYQLQMPAQIQTRLSMFSEGRRQQSKVKLAGVFVMGAISALIVGPCVAAPLAGALVYISQTRDVVIGGVALFSLALGMGVPLLLVGVSAGSVLPRAGVWMEEIKHFFGVLMLAMALWMISPVIPALAQMLAWAALFLAYGAYLLFLYRGGWFSKLFAVMWFALGGVQLVGAITGGRDVLSPLAHLSGGVERVHFQRIRSSAQLDAALARTQGKRVMFDFYADWCVACKEMEKISFVDPAVKKELDQMLLLQVDVTANNEDDKALLKRFGLFGPPGIIFFDASGKELPRSRVIGYQAPQKFLQSLRRLKN
ncbi:MAG: protein-disulfide reductase DsbD [Burkholderiales bacterium]|nr:protein-disulfide reductase DsbD [Burkholderiales bacterium]